MSKKYTLFTFKGICRNFLLDLIFFILSHPVTSTQPHKIVQIHMRHVSKENILEKNHVLYPIIFLTVPGLVFSRILVS